ncbi:MAG: hypothetical protein F2808_04070 [Actinobacteria bacterium]|uniref:Unannotated protein n=1 Tax=freshwater metagenome TaxID=449393 RepID=A0A6J7FRR8_9ZZZZ|nr:hypothetical protein [Actinomycetota bacterium]
MARSKRRGAHLLVRRMVLLGTVFLATLIPLRGFFFGQLLGDIGDARWTVSLYEHWFRVFAGQEAPASTLFFFPTHDTLGYSDAFLAPGIVHAALRAFAVDPVTSWSIATCVLIFLGNLGLALLATQVFKSLIVRIAFVMIAGTTYAFVSQLAHVQTLGYAIVWWVLALFLYGRQGSSVASRIAWFFMLPVLALGALTSWYPVFFFALIGAIALVLTFVFLRNGRWLLPPWRRARDLSWIGWGLSVGVTAALGVVWLAIYGPAFSSLAKPWDVYLTYGPHVTDVVNVMGGSGLWWDIAHVLSPNLEPTSMEHSLGITPALFVAFVVVCFSLTRKAIVKRRTAPVSIGVAAATVWATWLVVVIFGESGFSLFHFLWRFMPGASSIRSGLRVNVILSVLVVLIVAYLIEKWVIETKRKNTRRHVLRIVGAAALLAMIFIEQQRVTPANWRPDDFVPVTLRAAQAQLASSSCSSFLYVGSGSDQIAPWSVAVDATAIAVVTGMPTINGYSGNSPAGYPSVAAVESTAQAFIDWAAGQGVTETCLVTETRVRPIEVAAPG